MCGSLQHSTVGNVGQLGQLTQINGALSPGRSAREWPRAHRSGSGPPTNQMRNGTKDAPGPGFREQSFLSTVTEGPRPRNFMKEWGSLDVAGRAGQDRKPAEARIGRPTERRSRNQMGARPEAPTRMSALRVWKPAPRGQCKEAE